MVNNLKINPVKEGIKLYKAGVLIDNGEDPKKIQEVYGVSKKDLRKSNKFNEGNGYNMNLDRKEIIDEYNNLVNEIDEKLKREKEVKETVENIQNLLQTLQNIVDETEVKEKTR